MKPVVILSLAMAGAVEAAKGHCGGDNCARQVTGTRPALAPLSSRRADCVSFMKTTIVPDATTVTVTVTVEPEETLSTRTRGMQARRAATEAPDAVPAYASSCKGAGRYSSACACWGITPVVTTGPVPTETHTVTVTLDFCDEI